MSNEKVPERLWVQIFGDTPLSTVSVNAYRSDPREVHDNGKPVYLYRLETSTGEGDAQLAQGVVREWAEHDLDEHYTSFYLHDSLHSEGLESRIATALATVRKAEREAAFKVLCVDCAEGDTPVLDEKARWYYHGVDSKSLGCSASKLRRVASANGEAKGGDDG